MDENRQNGMISIGDYFKIPESELEFVFCRASGPGGQYVNRTDSAAQLRFDVVHSAGIPEEVRVRLLSQAAGQITSEGILLIEAREFRSQQRNKEAAIERFVKILKRAARKPKDRKSVV